MARDKASRVDKLDFDTRLQDGSALSRVINADVLKLLREMAAVIDALQDRSALILQGEIELDACQTSGVTVLQLEEPLDVEQRYSPVMMQQAPYTSFDDMDIAAVWLVARVKSATEIEVFWRSLEPVYGKIKVNCIIGAFT